MSFAPCTLPDADPAQFLTIAGQGAGLSTHADLWRWLQGDVQLWLEHEVMLIGWGDLRSGEPHFEFDIISSLPGMRSHHWTARALSPFIGYLRDCWTAAQRLPCQLDISRAPHLLRGCAASHAQLASIGAMRSALVHGIRDSRGAGEHIFAALSSRKSRPPGAGTALKLLLPFIDTALRRMPPAPVRVAPCESSHAGRLASLSERERQIMTWVAMGKTNPEIGCILCISEFTVKNHMKSIFAKLDVTNRAQAVAKLTRIDAHA